MHRSDSPGIVQQQEQHVSLLIYNLLPSSAQGLDHATDLCKYDSRQNDERPDLFQTQPIQQKANSNDTLTVRPLAYKRSEAAIEKQRTITSLIAFFCGITAALHQI